MVDLRGLLRKGVIANKQGLSQVRVKPETKEEPEENSGAKNRDVKPKEEHPFFSMERKPQAKSSISREYPKDYSIGTPISRSGRPASLLLYVFFFVISLIFLYFKSRVGYQPLLSFFISILQGLIFCIPFFSNKKDNKPKLMIIFTAMSLDLAVANGILGLWPESEMRDLLITLHVFTWVALSIVLFLMGAFENLGAGEKLPWWAWLLIALIFGYILIYLVFPALAQSPLAYQDETHAEYFHIAKEKLFAAGKTFEETTNSFLDYFTCSLDATKGVKYDKCLEEKRIIRYCKANFPAEEQDCIKQQQEQLKQGNRPGVAGAVSQLIKEVTTATLKEDQDFPKKATKPKMIYPVSLSVDNPRQQIFLVKPTCQFKKSKETISGTISIAGQEVREIQVNDQKEQFLIGCQPTADLNGRYSVDYEISLSGLQGFSFIKRAFMSKEIDPELRKQIEGDHFKSTDDRRSQSPKEFAKLNFKFGNGDGSSPLVLVEEPVTFSFSVEDIGGGEVVKVNSYDFYDHIDDGFTVDQDRIGESDCLRGGEIILAPAQAKKYQPSELKRCFLNSPPDLVQLQSVKNQFLVRSFVANFNYDYKIKRSIPIEVTPVGATTCSNKEVEQGEECDDGNKINTDACTNVCKKARCGDGYISTGTEQCDDGNIANGDNCSAECKLENVA